eukprot:2238195-Ditylum_brightwellii.AAC.2
MYTRQALKNNIKDTKLAGDELTDLKAFFDLINFAIGTAIGKSYAFKMYDEMQDSNYDVAKTLLPPEIHPKYQKATDQLNNLSQILLTHLIYNNAIDMESSPMCYNILQANRHCQCGFDLLITLIFGVSHQLGRQHDDAQMLVNKFSIKSGEQLSNFHHRALNTQETIHLMQDQTGQSKKIIGKYIEHLNTQQGLQIHMVRYNKYWN